MGFVPPKKFSLRRPVHTDINNIGNKTHRGSALTNYYRRPSMFNCGDFRLTATTLIVAILD